MKALALVSMVLVACLLGMAQAQITQPLTGGSNTDPAMVANPRVNLAQFSASSSLVKAMADIHDRFGTYLFDRAARLGCEAAALAAIIYIESGGKGFSGARMIIRFENHVFRPRLNNDALFFDHFTYNTDQQWTGHTWRPTTTEAFQTFHGDQTKEWTVLQFAQSLSDIDALESASYGAPQIMGFNAQSIGYANARAMFLAFSNSLENQMDGMVAFIKGRSTCLTGLRTNDFVLFASCYNGAGQADAYGANILAARNAYVSVLSILGITPPAPCQTGGLYGACNVATCEGETYAGAAACGVGETCCIDRIPCKPSGQPEGSCMDQTLCAAPGQLFSGLCPGGATIRCCVGAPTRSPVTPPPLATSAPTSAACTYEGLAGQCTASCSASNFFGYTDAECTGGTVCCVPAQSCSPAAGVFGSCLDASVCSGSTFSGLCPGSSNIRCCVPSAGTTAPTLATTAPTTRAPTITTLAPTTLSPTLATLAPTTRAPTLATSAPTTRAPTLASQAPTVATQAPTTRSPTTGAPTTRSPTLATGSPTLNSCTYEGLMGQCSLSCSGNNVFGYTDAECLGGTVCCAPAQACSPSAGVSGTCLDVSVCSGTTFSGLCPGSANIRCCVPPTLAPTTARPTTRRPTTRSPTFVSCTYEGLAGQCRASCSGSSNTFGYIDSECTGGTVCCAPAQACSPSAGVSGTCLDVSVCSGTTFSGLCPGSANIRCCVPSGSQLASEQGASTTGGSEAVAAGVTIPLVFLGFAAAAVVVVRRRKASNVLNDPSRWSVVLNSGLDSSSSSAHNPMFIRPPPRDIAV